MARIPEGTVHPSGARPVLRCAERRSPTAAARRVGPRALGLIIDYACQLVVLLPFIVLGNLTHSAIGPLGYLAALGVFVCFAVQIGETGQSREVRVAGVTCVSMTTGSTIGSGTGIGRGFATYINGFVCGVRWLFPLWDAKKQTLADVIISTLVCVVPKQSFGLIPSSAAR